jgi:hypothetical protein
MIDGVHRLVVPVLVAIAMHKGSKLGLVQTDS